MSAKSWSGRTKQELIIEVWEALDCESVGESELEQIQEVLQAEFGAGGLESPASIARTVADEGAVLRHPEVFAYDAKWRERLISDSADLESLSFSSLADAAESIRKLDSWRRQGKQVELRRLMGFALSTKQDLQLMRRSSLVDAKKRLEAGEIEQWLTIWMQDPNIFADWLSLRRRTPDFIKKFSD
jgi:hypothetical protein